MTSGKVRVRQPFRDALDAWMREQPALVDGRATNKPPANPHRYNALSAGAAGRIGGKIGGLRGGKTRAEKLSPERRKEIAILGAEARWNPKP